ncbi:MAG: hypothetical protein MNPFHGCM_02624 [Gemmatimonadaceae bacterium]|nr:hypothetical protein [Gemmatimonadaceae bacterium]
MRIRFAAAAATIVLAACATDTPDAYGTFEATEVTVSAETSGRFLSVPVEEGSRIASGAIVAVVDTAPLVLQRAELGARRATVESRASEADAQWNVIEAQRVVAQREYERTARLVAAAAATSQQADRATRDLRTLEAQGEVVKATKATVSRDLGTVRAQIAVLEDRIERSVVVAPAPGTVLARYVEAGELAQPGLPIVRIAALDTLTFRAYVPESQLRQLKLGGDVTVQVDGTGGSLRRLPGKVRWISATAEFTPTPIQTREERVTQVYAVKIAVANQDGGLKIGMPGELILGGAVK